MVRIFVVILVVLAGLVAGVVVLQRDGGGKGIQASLSVVEAMASDTTGYRRADRVRDFVFPDDYGAHPGYKTEWWYYTGNLDTDEGRHFGYELTIFRFALTPPDAVDTSRSSAWATNQLFMGHFALTDVQDDRFYAFERFSRGAAGLAGAEADPYRVWLENWQVTGAGSGQPFPMHLHAEQDGVALDLTLETAKPVVLQGERGLDQKGPEPGNASYYYSFTRMPSAGTVTIDGQAFAVQGLSWNDHEWSTSALAADMAGWDWFALQLSNGVDLMYYQLRRRDGSASPFTTGTLVRPDGTTQVLAPDEVVLDVLDTWSSPIGGTYPARWRLRIPSMDLDLTVTPYLANQELNHTVRYWEGAVFIGGSAGGEPVAGDGYVELTGYGDEAEPSTTAPVRGAAAE